MSPKWFRKLGYLFYFIGILILVSPFVGTHGLMDYLKLTHSEQAIQKELRKLQHNMEQIRRKLRHLAHDKRAEKSIIHEFGSGESDETVLLLQPSYTDTVPRPQFYSPPEGTK